MRKRITLALNIAALAVSIFILICLMFNIGVLADLELPERGISILMGIGFTFYYLYQIAGHAMDEYERGADTKHPLPFSDNGAESGDMKETTEYLLGDNQRRRW